MSEDEVNDLPHDEALRHVMHDEILERLDAIIALLKEEQRPAPDKTGFMAAWRVAERFRLGRRISASLRDIFVKNPSYIEE